MTFHLADLLSQWFTSQLHVGDATYCAAARGGCNFGCRTTCALARSKTLATCPLPGGLVLPRKHFRAYWRYVASPHCGGWQSAIILENDGGIQHLEVDIPQASFSTFQIVEVDNQSSLLAESRQDDVLEHFGGAAFCQFFAERHFANMLAE